MAVLFMDGFDTYPTADIYKNGRWSYKTGGDVNIGNWNYRTGGYCVYIDNGGLHKTLASNYSTLAVGAYMRQELSQYGPSSFRFFGFYDGSSLQVDLNRDADGGISAYRNGTLLATTTQKGIIMHAVPFHLQVKAVFSDTAGSLEVRINDRAVMTLTNIDNVATANASASGVRLVGSYANRVFFDDLWVDDSGFLGDCKVHTLMPSAAGETTSWTPSASSNYDCVNELQQNGDTDYVFSATANQIDTYAYGDLVPATGTVYAVVSRLVARKDDAGNRTVAPVIRPGSTDIVGDGVYLSDVYTPYEKIYLQNPETLQPWTIAEVNATQFGIKLVE